MHEILKRSEELGEMIEDSRNLPLREWLMKWGDNKYSDYFISEKEEEILSDQDLEHNG